MYWIKIITIISGQDDPLCNAIVDCDCNTIVDVILILIIVRILIQIQIQIQIQIIIVIIMIIISGQDGRLCYADWNGCDS